MAKYGKDAAAIGALAGRPWFALLCGIVAATAGSLRLCSAIKGTSSCGGQGFFLLVANGLIWWGLIALVLKFRWMWP